MNPLASNNPPQSNDELLARVESIAGFSLSQLADSIGWATPDNLLHNKGWIGQLIESLLGATAGSLSEPDFQHLGIELKTIPVKANGKPAETTYVCMVPLDRHTGLQWHQSCVAKKLAHVLWLPIESDKKLKLADRRIGSGFLWQADAQQWQSLRDDWEELMEYVALGEVNQIDASFGQYLHIRPKGANAKARTLGINQGGRYAPTLPRGFYLRTDFTEQILKTYTGSS